MNIEELFYCCPICKGMDIEAMAWVNINTEKLISFIDDYYDGSYYCNSCEKHLKEVEIIHEPVKNK